ncbi:hypothetical protein GGU10DRAFT_341223 [Lentinula aff. detonsa]|uniref:Uncharacterized protein n=1 Tax=Lentinula aff. detonsa TaxID=2804958 RepID=A0AA38NS80_9AGAR|nr:hypothetical protein GGU10DRAFT_341223 [Lentinula aff. detonsa]
MPALAARTLPFADTLICSAASTSAVSELVVDESTASATLTRKLRSSSASTPTHSEVGYYTTASDPLTLEATRSSRASRNYELHTSSHNSWKNNRCTFTGSCNADAIESQALPFTKTKMDVVSAATPCTGAVKTFFTMAASTPSSTTNNIATSATSRSIDISTKKHSERSVVGRAVGGAVGGAMFLITALFMFLLLRRNRQRKRSPSQQYLQSVRSVSRSAGAVSPDRDIKDFSSSRTTSPTKDKQTASYSKGFTRHPFITDSESGSTFKDSSVTIQSISAPFVPPPPRTNVPEAQPPQERLPNDLRNRPSRFVEQLMVNSTNLGVLLAIAKAEAEQRKGQEEITLSRSMTPLVEPEHDNERHIHELPHVGSLSGTLPSPSEPFLRVAEEPADNIAQYRESTPHVL